MSDVKIIARGGFDAGDGIDTTFDGGRDCGDAAGRGVRATHAGARLRLLQEPRRADLPRKEGRPHPLRRLPRGFQQQLPSREARTRRECLDRGAIAPQLRDGCEARQSGRSGEQPADATSTCAGGRRSRIPLGRPPVRVEERQRLEDACGVRQWREGALVHH
jgi:hypothetical protein